MVQDWFGYYFHSKYPSDYFCPEKRCLVLITATKSASYIHHAGSTFLHWFSLYHHHCLKSHGETSLLSIPSWDYSRQSQGNDCNGSQSVQTLAKNGLPFLCSQTLKVANGCRRMLGKEWGVCAKAPRFSSVSPEGPVPHLFVQKKGLGGFTPSCQQWPSFTILEVSLYLFLYPWFYDLIQWTSSDLVAGLKHIFNLKNQAF